MIFLLIIKTYILLIPYVIVLTYFYLYKKDDYFYKVRSSVQLTLVLILIGIFFLNIVFWKIWFAEYAFLSFSIKNTAGNVKTTALATLLSASAAVSGWVFTSRVQIINATKAHAMQALMNSRNSTIYTEKVEKATYVASKIKEKHKLKDGDQIVVSENDYLELEPDERNAIHYLLNFLEFISVGVRHNNMDEELIKGSLKSILKNNYIMFEPVIEYVRKRSPSNYTEMETLHKRWDEYTNDKCSKCTQWFKVSSISKEKNKPERSSLYAIVSLITLFTWNLFIFITENLKNITESKNEDFVCVDCEKKTDEII